MGEKKLPVAIERARCEFADWRSRKQPRERIPERLWRIAVEAARLHGVHAVSCALRLEHSRLRQRVEAADSGGSGSSEFVEITGEPSAAGAGCTVELEKGNGVRMRICVRDGASVDWSRLKEAFLGA